MDEIIPALQKHKTQACSCIICGNQKAEELFEYRHNQGTYSLLACTLCAHIFIDPVPLVLADRSMDISTDLSPLFGFLKRNLIIKREIRAVKRHLSAAPTPTLLDIGCGTGWATNIWRQHGFDVAGIEPSAASRKICKEKHGIPAFAGTIETTDLQKCFDVIILEHLLEHTENPAATLQWIHSHLKDNGLLLISTPNINSAGRFWFREEWTWGLPFHLHFFIEKNLLRLLGENNFLPLTHYQSGSPHYHLWSLQRILKKKLGIRSFSNLFNLIVLLILSPLNHLLALAGWGENITVICQKSERKGS